MGSADRTVMVTTGGEAMAILSLKEKNDLRLRASNGDTPARQFEDQEEAIIALQKAVFRLQTAFNGEFDSLVIGMLTLNGFRLLTGASAGYLLTSDAFGNGTWQPAPVAVSAKVADLSATGPHYPGSGLINSSNVDFVLPGPYAPGSLSSAWDGVVQAPGFVAIIETNPATGAFAFSFPPDTGVKVVVSYGAA